MVMKRRRPNGRPEKSLFTDISGPGGFARRNQRRPAEEGIEMNCLDCKKNGGDGPRCLQHEEDYLRMEIRNNRRRIREIRKARRDKFGG